jgi:hypothetical protein
MGECLAGVLYKLGKEKGANKEAMALTFAKVLNDKFIHLLVTDGKN